MATHGLFVGINYTGSNNQLRGCINDARSWLAFFGPFCASVKELLEQSATKAGMVAAIQEVLAKLKPDDTAIITYSGHGCFSGDTRVSLLSGGSMSMAELHDAYRDGGEFWVYSCKPDGSIVPGKARSPRITKTDHVLRVTLDNGESVRCTADHRFMLRDGTYRCAGNLQPGDSLMPLYRKMSSREAPSRQLDGYEMCFIQSDAQLAELRKANAYPGSDRYVYTHRFVGYCVGKNVKGKVLHHRDFNKRNNCPENLEPLTRREHMLVHAHSEERKAKNRAAMIVRNQEYDWPADVRKKTGEISRINRLKDWQDSEYREKVSAGLRKSWENASADDPRLAGLKKAMANAHTAAARKKRGESGSRTRRNPGSKAYVQCHSEETRLQLISINKKANHTRWHVGRGIVKDDCDLCQLAAHPVNHKVVSVELTGDIVPVYDITVDEFHNFALEAGVFVHNSYIPDQSGDEEDGRDEALCPFDLNRNLLLDDELRDLLAQRVAGSKVLIVTDCCHSGTATRDLHEIEHGDVKFARYVPFAELTACMCPNDVDGITRKAREYRKHRRHARAAEPAMNLVHLAGCLDTEVSYDATIGGQACGAFTYYALAALKSRQTKGLTYGEWRDAVTPVRLPSKYYPQTPVFNGPMSLVVPGFEPVVAPATPPAASSQVLNGVLSDGRKFELKIG